MQLSFVANHFHTGNAFKTQKLSKHSIKRHSKKVKGRCCKRNNKKETRNQKRKKKYPTIGCNCVLE